MRSGWCVWSDCLCSHLLVSPHASGCVLVSFLLAQMCVFMCLSRNTKYKPILTWSNHPNHLDRADKITCIGPRSPFFSFHLNTTKTQHDRAGISTGPLRRAAAHVINGVRWIMSILCDWTESAESLKVREEHVADCFPKTAHWSLSDRGHLVFKTRSEAKLSVRVKAAAAS